MTLVVVRRYQRLYDTLGVILFWVAILFASVDNEVADITMSIFSINKEI
jgi:hypothetical protein